MWLYRFAFVSVVGLSLVFLDFTLQARAKWYPSYEEKLLAGMKQIENAAQLPAKPKVQTKKANAKMRAKRQSKGTT